MKGPERSDEVAAQLELMLRQEEERVLVKASAKLSAQLNRLKVEELALLSQMRNSNIRSSQQRAETADVKSFPGSIDVPSDLTIPLTTASNPAASSSMAIYQTSEELNRKALCLDVKQEQDKSNGKKRGREMEEEEEEEEEDAVHVV